jgi:apolipoprotein D and lipocalin family protein
MVSPDLEELAGTVLHLFLSMRRSGTFRRMAVIVAVCGAIAAVVFAGTRRQGNRGNEAPGKPEVVPSVDLNRYAGTWYEVARLPNRFQRKCVSDVTATYTLRDNGKIEVVNRCREADGSINDAKGTARPASKDEPNSKLKVTFFWPFSGDYWILGLDPTYRWALVGEPDRRNLWVLSREPRMDEDQLQEILDRAKAQGYDLSGLIKTEHTGV